ncbi:MAG TPA: LacI family DNA-binding transcriptional regulator [Micropruina sp.]|nr:LacI family DNA-binding transcriptional regulator [Micropruina sp.]HMR20802.1 LacI family DNA-binding transcriptional regulator [Micropruina sp.]
MSEATPAVSRTVVTRADVARYAGVSSAVVSYVVNDGPRPVAPATAERVRRAIEVLGYRPNSSARALRRGVSDTIGLVIPDSSNPFFAELGLEIQRLAAMSDRAVLMASTMGNRRQEQRILEDLLGRQVEGMIVRGDSSHRDPLANLRVDVPYVLVDTMVPIPGQRSVGSDLRQGADMLVEHLITVHGLTRVGLIMGEDLSGLADPRELGWRDAQLRHALPEGPIARGVFSRPGGYAAMRRMIASGKLPQAVFASSDLQAIGVLRALHEAGLGIPGDIAVVTFDGSIEAEYSWPALTAARQPIADIAAEAFRMITESTETGEVFHLFPTELILRSSCGCSTT